MAMPSGRIAPSRMMIFQSMDSYTSLRPKQRVSAIATAPQIAAIGIGSQRRPDTTITASMMATATTALWRGRRMSERSLSTMKRSSARTLDVMVSGSNSSSTSPVSSAIRLIFSRSTRPRRWIASTVPS